MNFDRRLGAQHPNAGRNTQQLYVFYLRKFPKLASEMQVSFVNEAPGSKINKAKIEIFVFHHLDCHQVEI
jgi:hypothetical protein